MLLGGACWGISGTCAQYMFDRLKMDSQWLTPIRLFYSGVFLLAYCLFKFQKQTFAPFKSSKDIILLLIYGIGGISFSQYLYFLCIQLSSAGVGAIMMNIAPIPVLIISCLLAKR